MWFKCQVDIEQFSSVIRLGPECNPTCICMGERTSDTEHCLTEGEESKGSQERDHAVDCGELQGKGMQLWMLEKMLRETNSSLYSFRVTVCLHIHVMRCMWKSKNSLWELVFSFYHMGPGDWTQTVSFSPSLLQSWRFRATKTSATSEMFACYQFGCQFEMQPWPFL